MPSVISKDGTAIAYDKVGHGQTILSVNGALAHRTLYGEHELASLLSKKFSVICYDRRGRGESMDTKPYAVEREIEDIEALIQEAGGKVFLQGTSSGAALALLAASQLGSDKVLKLALYEPPYSAYADEDKNKFAWIKRNVEDLIRKNKPEDAIALFFESQGIPPKELQAMKKSPDWKKMEAIAFTLVYDFEVLGNGAIPADTAKTIAIPTLVLDGEKSFDFMHQTADQLAKTISGASRKTLKNQTHQASAEALAPVLTDFFGK